MDKKVEKNKKVALSYTLIVDGEVADQAGSDKPLEYVHGTGMLLPRFEEEVEGKVAAVKEDTVAMDFNHPMAGKTLHFSGKVESVKD